MAAYWNKFAERGVATNDKSKKYYISGIPPKREDVETAINHASTVMQVATGLEDFKTMLYKALGTNNARMSRWFMKIIDGMTAGEYYMRDIIKCCM